MGAEVVNLRQARKAKARAGKQAQADRNRIIFGRTKAERRLATSMQELEAERLDGKVLTKRRLEPGSQG